MVNYMNNKEYKELTKGVIPKTFKIKKIIIAFLVGGLVGVIGQLLITLYSSFEEISMSKATNMMMVTLILISSSLTGIGVFDHLVSKAGAGLIVPITGFSHSTTSSAMEYRKEGLVYGLGANIFKLSGSVILYGVVSAYFFGIIKYLVFGG